MMRLHAVVEGQSEEAFLNDVLAPELAAKDVFIVCHRVTTGRRGGFVFRGGIGKYQQLKTDLTLWMKQESRQQGAWFTTMVDLYALPDDFPGYHECARSADPVRRVECLEQRLWDDLSHRRFIPYIQLHEFEALLFSDPRQFEIAFPGDPGVIDQLTAIGSQFPTPEHIDDRPDLAPSKRILKVLPDYRKPVAGPLILKQIGLTTLRRECPHFNQWIERIEEAASQ
jgi:hypothetical protein